MPAKPQSGRAIELGLALRIVSKRGRQVMFGQTGLLFANRQWVDVPMGSQYSVPIPWPLTAELMSVVSVHGGDDNYDMWPSYNGKTLHSTAKNINGYVIGIFQ